MRDAPADISCGDQEEGEGTVPFMAPEVLDTSLLGDGEGYDFAIDRFSFAAMMLYLFVIVLFQRGSWFSLHDH